MEWSGILTAEGVRGQFAGGVADEIYCGIYHLTEHLEAHSFAPSVPSLRTDERTHSALSRPIVWLDSTEFQGSMNVRYSKIVVLESALSRTNCKTLE
jgi:hypothetical protein